MYKGYITPTDRQSATIITWEKIYKHKWQARLGQIHWTITHNGKTYSKTESTMIATLNGIHKNRVNKSREWLPESDQFIYFESPTGKIYRVHLS